jgi:protein subunit release factor B
MIYSNQHINCKGNLKNKHGSFKNNFRTQYKAVRNSGAGGQNVNKVSSKVVLSFDLKKRNLI